MAIDTRTVGGWAMGLAGAALAVAVVTAVPSPDPFARTQTGQGRAAAGLSDLATDNSTSNVAVLAGGCFWGVQGVYQHSSALPAPFPATPAAAKAEPLRPVGTGGTGHAEAVGSASIRPGQLWPAAADLLLGRARPDRVEPPGARRRDPVPIDDLSGQREASRLAAAYIAQLNAPVPSTPRSSRR